MLNKSEATEITAAQEEYSATIQEFIQKSGLPADFPHEKAEEMIIAFATSILSLVFATPEIVLDFVNTDTEKAPLFDVQKQLKEKWRDFTHNTLKDPSSFKTSFLEALKTVFSNDEFKRYFTSTVQNTSYQAELFPVFAPQKSVELKRDFALNFGGLERIEKDYKKLLKEKLSSGLTLQQHINKVKSWFNGLHGDDLGNWLKLFAYVKAVKSFSETNGEAINFRILGEGRYCFSIKQSGDFYSYFIRPDKKTGQFTTKAKNKFLKWLHDNQNAIEFPMILNGKVWNVPMRIYQYAENVSDKEILFIVDTNILESEFRDYVSINIDEIDAIGEAWEMIATQNPEFAKFRLNNFLDIPLKFLLTLKNIYSREGNYTNGDFSGNSQRLKKEHLDEHLGGLSERIAKHLTIRHVIRSGKTSDKPLEIKRLILETTWKIAVQRGWLMSEPTYNTETEMYKFNINTGYFDRKATAQRLIAPQKI